MRAEYREHKSRSGVQRAHIKERKEEIRDMRTQRSKVQRTEIKDHKTKNREEDRDNKTKNNLQRGERDKWSCRTRMRGER